MPMYTRSQSLAIRDRIFSELERSSREDVLGHDKLHVCIVGGGPTGVEIAGALADFRMQELDILYPEMDPGTLQVTVLQRGDELIKEFSPKYREYAAEELRDRGVTLRLGHGVKSVGYDHVVLDNGSILESDITIWAAGVAIPESVKEWGLPQDKRGRIAVDDYLQVKGFPGVYAAGDIAGQDEPLPSSRSPRSRWVRPRPGPSPRTSPASPASGSRTPIWAPWPPSAVTPRSPRSPTWAVSPVPWAGPRGSACTSPR